LLALNNKYLGLKATSEINEARNWRYTQKILCRRLYEADVPEVVDVMQPFLGLAGVTEVSGKHLVVSDELMKEEYK